MKQIAKTMVSGVILLVFTGLVFGQSVTPIHDIQYATEVGSGCYDSPLDSNVVTVSGIVMAVSSSGRFYLQDGGTTWDGIYVYDTSVQPSQGDSVTFTAEVDEYYGLSELKNVADSTIHSSGNALFDPISATTGELGAGCSDTGEPYEGLLVVLTDVTVSAEANNYGEWYVDDGSGECQIDDDFFSVTPSVGDFFDSITGVVDYGYGEYEVNPRGADDVVTTAIGPTLVSVDFVPTFPVPDEDVSVTATAYDDKAGLVVELNTSDDGGTTWASTTMTDNSDSTYSGTIAGQTEGVSVDFFVLLTDSDSNTEQSDTFTVTFSSVGEITSIYDIQYVPDPDTDDASPLVDQEVTITGIVTAEFWGGSGNRNIYVQDDEAAWSGIVVFEYGGWDNFDINSPEGVVHSVAEGDSVVITGTVVEYYNKTEITDVTSFDIIAHGSLAVNPLAVTCQELTDNAESYEGVLVGIADCSVDDPDLGYGEWSITDGTGSARLDDNWDYYYWPEAAQDLSEVVGVLDYTYSNYKIQPRLARDVVEEGTARIQRIQQVLYSDLIKAGEDEVSDMSYMYGDTVTLEGIVTMPTGLSFAGDGVKFIYEDEHGGPWSAILSYDPDSSAFPVLYEGDLVRATGYVYEYSTGPANMTELFVTEPVEIVDVGVDQPAVDTVATGDLRWPTEAEPWGNVMVRVADVTVMENDLPYGEWSVDDGSGGVNIDDDSDSIAVWQEENGRPPEGTFIQSIRGWVYHHYGSYGDSTAYKLEPLYVSDIEFGAGPPNIQDVGRAPCVPGPADDVVVGCEISDNSVVATAEIMYSVDGSAYSSAAMSNTSGTSWEGTIPATGVDGAKVDYYIVATDDGEGQDEPKSSTYPTDIEQLQLSYTTTSGDLAISDIQFTEWPIGDSPYNGCEVTVTGIVTGDTAQYYSFYFQDTYTIQSEEGPWNGVIFAGWDGSQLTRGDEVTITGTVEEYDDADPYGHFQWDNNTKIIGVSDVVVHSSGNSIDAFPVQTADLAQDADDVESYEGSLVTLTNVTVSALNSYDWSVVDESGIACLIDDDMANDAADAFLSALEEGQSLSTVTGIFVFSFGTYKIEIRDMADLGEVGIGDNVEVQPYTYKLYPNFPNPFNPETRIRFEIPERERVKVIIYDILGHHVRTLTNRDYDRGYHVLNWDGRNDAGALVSSGVYVCRIKSGKFIDHNKMTLVR